MDRFIMQHRERIAGTLTCFDRVNFKGHLLAISHAQGLDAFVTHLGLTLRDFKDFAVTVAGDLKSYAQALARRAGREYRYLAGPVRKEGLAREIVRRDAVKRGLACVFGTVEPCLTFRLAYGDGRPTLRSAWRKCLVHYAYFVDPAFGLLHVRLQTWFPFTMQVCLNGHEWLARQMDRARLTYRQLDNAFVSIARPDRAQRIAHGFARLDWPGILDGFARRLNPLKDSLVADLVYHWVADQTEVATDLMFKNRQALQDLYPSLVHHATASFGSEDVLRYLGRRLDPRFQGEVVSDLKRRPEGVRVKHRVTGNWIKMYDKHGRVLRVETVINRPRDFKVRRVTRFRGVVHARWVPMPKGVAYLDRVERIGRAANHRYLDALADVTDVSAAGRALDHMPGPTFIHGRRARGFNPAAADDARLFAAVLKGEHAVSGFRNRHVREALFGPHIDDPVESKRRSARVTRALNRLHALGYIAKIPRTRRWRVTRLGHATMAAVLKVRQEHFPAAFQPAA